MVCVCFEYSKRRSYVSLAQFGEEGTRLEYVV
jgi:hypothetical protein